MLRSALFNITSFGAFIPVQHTAPLHILLAATPTRPAHAGRDNADPVMPRQRQIRLVQDRIVKAGVGDAGTATSRLSCWPLP